VESTTKEPRDRPHSTDVEIEVTPAMIEAGVDVFYDLPEMPPGEQELRAAVSRCFLAMLRASRKDHCDTDTRALEAL
jgi:hypothetical protein